MIKKSKITILILSLLSISTNMLPMRSFTRNCLHTACTTGNEEKVKTAKLYHSYGDIVKGFIDTLLKVEKKY